MPGKLVTFAVVAGFALAGCGGDDNDSGSGGSSTGSGSSGGTATTPAAGGAAPDGAKLFVSNGCSGCHTLKAAGSQAGTGPDLDAKLPEDAKENGKDIKEFAKESIEQPGAYIAKGFSDGIMPKTYKQSLKPEEIDALVDYITGS